MPLSAEIAKLLKIRLNDQSCITRELCLEMLGDTDIELLITMASDRSVTVRSKVV